MYLVALRLQPACSILLLIKAECLHVYVIQCDVGAMANVRELLLDHMHSEVHVRAGRWLYPFYGDTI